MALEREKSQIFIKQYLDYGFKPLLANIELSYKICLLYDLIYNISHRNYDECFDSASILFNYARDGIVLSNNTEDKTNYVILYNLLSDLKYINNIDFKKYINELNKILDHHLKELASNLSDDKFLKLEGNNDSIYYQIFNNFKIIVFNFMNNIINKKINGQNKAYFIAMNKVLLNIHSSLVHAYTILLPEKYDYESLIELESEYRDYLISLKEVLECLKEGRDITDELANQCVYNYEAINSSMNLEANIDVLCFGGKNDEYEKIRECLLFKR